MLKSLLLFFILSVSLNGLYAQADTSIGLEIGKRNNWLFDREISSYQLARYNRMGYRIFYKDKYMNEYKPIGFLGRRIKEYFVNNPKAFREFMQFRNKTIFYKSSFLLPVVIEMAWFFDVINYHQSNTGRQINGLGDIFLPTPRFYLYPLSGIALLIAGPLVGMEGEQNLMMATYYVNGERNGIKK